MSKRIMLIYCIHGFLYILVKLLRKKNSDILDSLQFSFDDLHLKNETFNFYIRGHKNSALV